MTVAMKDMGALMVTVECEECGESGYYTVHADMDSTRHECVACEAVVWAARPERVEWTYRMDGVDFRLNFRDNTVCQAWPDDEEWAGPFEFNPKGLRAFESTLQRDGVRLD